MIGNENKIGAFDIYNYYFWWESGGFLWKGVIKWKEALYHISDKQYSKFVKFYMQIAQKGKNTDLWGTQ